MDKILSKKLSALKEKVEVRDGENPLLHIEDAIKIGIRADVLRRAIPDGEYYAVKWIGVPLTEGIHRTRLCESIVDRILEGQHEDRSEPEPEPDVFICPECAKEYKTRKGLDNHIKSKH